MIGCGAVGLSVVQGARLAGASEIRAIDLDEEEAGAGAALWRDRRRCRTVDFAFDVVRRRSTFGFGLEPPPRRQNSSF